MVTGVMDEKRLRDLYAGRAAKVQYPEGFLDMPA